MVERSRLVEELRTQVCTELGSVGVNIIGRNGPTLELSKESIRQMHSAQRYELVNHERKVLLPKFEKLILNFADGREVVPDRIQPVLIPVRAEDETGFLFRLATLLWSVPVSRGFGRRMRFLVRDGFNGKIIGIFALGDPVFNLKARDTWIGWSVRDREARLANVMDAYVVGSVPPYSQLLGGKLVTSLIGSNEVSAHFKSKYEGRRGIISGQTKLNALSLVTVTSALGRSSLYNRVHLPGLIDLIKVGETNGWGHFHVSNQLFEQMRRLLMLDGHPYASGYKYGTGPNWRMRVVRAALVLIGMDPNLMRHGIAREAYVMPLAKNCRQFLQRKSNECVISRPACQVITEACLDRWVIPRAVRRPEFKRWTRMDTVNLFNSLEATVGERESETTCTMV